MSSYRACAIPGRVVLIHDMPDHTVVSELEADQATLLLHQLRLALASVHRADEEPGAGCRMPMIPSREDVSQPGPGAAAP